MRTIATQLVLIFSNAVEGWTLLLLFRACFLETSASSLTPLRCVPSKTGLRDLSVESQKASDKRNTQFYVLKFFVFKLCSYKGLGLTLI